MPDSNQRTYRRFVLQYDYNGKRLGDPDDWEWTDYPAVIRGSTREDAEAYARNKLAGIRESKFIRGYRLVERTFVETDEVLVDLTLSEAQP